MDGVKNSNLFLFELHNKTVQKTLQNYNTCVTTTDNNEYFTIGISKGHQKVLV